MLTFLCWNGLNPWNGCENTNGTDYFFSEMPNFRDGTDGTDGTDKITYFIFFYTSHAVCFFFFFEYLHF